MTTLTTSQLEDRYATAVEAEEDARAALEALQVQSATAGEEPSKAERAAEAALAVATTARERFEAALSVSRRRDAADARGAAAREVEMQDALTGKALTDVQDAAEALTEAIKGYVECYGRLARAWSHAQGRVSYNDRLRAGAGLPNPEHAVADELARLSVTLGDGVLPPGASARAIQYGDVHTAPPLAETFASHTRAYIADLARTRA